MRDVHSEGDSEHSVSSKRCERAACERADGGADGARGEASERRRTRAMSSAMCVRLERFATKGSGAAGNDDAPSGAHTQE